MPVIAVYCTAGQAWDQEGHGVCMFSRVSLSQGWSFAWVQSFCAMCLLLAGAGTSVIFVMTNILSQQRCVFHNKHVFVMTKHVFCHDKSMLGVTKLLLWQNYVCHDKSFIVTDICHNKHMFLVTKAFSQQAYFCWDKRHVLSWQTHVCCDKSMHVEHPTDVIQYLLW